MAALIPAALMLMVWLWPRVWFWAVRNRLLVEVDVPKRQARSGEAVAVRVTVRNLAWVPCPFVKVSVELPEGLSARQDRVEQQLACTTFLMMRQEVQITLHCFGWRRGPHRLRHVVFHVNDGFGLKPLFMSQDVHAEIIILPDLVDIKPQHLSLREVQGALEIQRWLFPDESRLRGIREYEPGDPYKYLAWHASARTGRWMTKQFAASTEGQAALLLNAQMFDPYWYGTNREAFDMLCTLAASWAEWLGRHGFRVIFATNAMLPLHPFAQWHGMLGPAGIRSLLGRVLPYANGPFEGVLRGFPRFAPDCRVAVVCSQFQTRLQEQLLAELARAGREMFIVSNEGRGGPIP